MSNKKLALGTMGMSFKNKDTSIATIHKALDEGITIFNTGDFYNKGESHIVLGEALNGIPRDNYFVSLKFGVSFGVNGASLDVKPENIRKQLLAALDAMGLSYVDIYQPARLDIAIPVEDIMTEMVKLKEEGLIRHIGLSQVDADALRRACKVHPIHSVEVEYSLLNREVEEELIKTAKELGVRVVVYGAVGHGVLTDKILKGDFDNPMLSRGVLSPINKSTNLEILNKFAELAEKNGLTMSEMALAWTQSKYDNILSLIGTTNPEHLMSSIKAINCTLNEETIIELENLISDQTLKGLVKRKWIFENGVGRMV